MPHFTRSIQTVIISGEQLFLQGAPPVFPLTAGARCLSSLHGLAATLQAAARRGQRSSSACARRSQRRALLSAARATGPLAYRGSAQFIPSARVRRSLQAAAQPALE